MFCRFRSVICFFVFCFSCRFAFNMAGLACFILFCFALFLLLLSAHIIVDIIWALSCSVFLWERAFVCSCQVPRALLTRDHLTLNACMSSIETTQEVWIQAVKLKSLGCGYKYKRKLFIPLHTVPKFKTD